MNVKQGKHKIKLPLGTGRRQGPIPVLEILPHKILVVDIVYQRDLVSQMPTGCVDVLDVYGNKLTIPLSTITHTLEVCATMFKNKKRGVRFLRHPMKVKWLRAGDDGQWISSKEMTTVVNSIHGNWDGTKCYWYENNFSL